MATGHMADASGASGRAIAAPRAPILAVAALFFIWGGLTSLNDVLIPKLRGLFSLTYTEAMLTQFSATRYGLNAADSKGIFDGAT